MKKEILKSILLTLALVAFGYSCTDDDEEKDNHPEISLTEVGHNNSLQAKQGGDLHLEADIQAYNLIKRIDVEIHQEEGSEEEIEKSYTEGKYIGVKNTLFHEHIDIPENMPLGEYHLHFSVTDMKGYTTTKEVHINIIENDGIDDDDDE